MYVFGIINNQNPGEIFERKTKVSLENTLISITNHEQNILQLFQQMELIFER